MTLNELERAEHDTRVALDNAVAALAAARRAAPPFTPMPVEYHDNLNAARDAWNQAYDAWYAAHAMHITTITNNAL